MGSYIRLAEVAFNGCKWIEWVLRYASGLSWRNLATEYCVVVRMLGFSPPAAPSQEHLTSPHLSFHFSRILSYVGLSRRLERPRVSKYRI